MNYLSICACVKDEDNYIDEWINYHELIGVEKFIIYDNESKNPLKSSDNIEVISLSGFGQQMNSMNDCIVNHSDSKWIAFIDVDEFIVPKEDIHDLLKNYEEFGGFGINWQCFGSSGHLTNPGSTLKNFLRRAKNDFHTNNHIKTIVRPERVICARDPHIVSFIMMVIFVLMKIMK